MNELECTFMVRVRENGRPCYEMDNLTPEEAASAIRKHYLGHEGDRQVQVYDNLVGEWTHWTDLFEHEWMLRSTASH